MDETAIRLNDPSNYTYEIRGSQRVKAITSVHEMNKISVAFCASLSGMKLPALMLVPRKTPLPNLTPPANVLVVYRSSATFDGVSIRDHFLRRVLYPHLDMQGFIIEF